MNALTLHAIAHRLWKWKIPFIPKCIQLVIFILFNSYIPYELKIGKGCSIGHRGIGVVINKTCKIGENCLIRAHVTIGGKNGEQCPVIGNSVEIGDGAKILGAVTIGDFVKIGANAVVINDVPSGCTAIGVPARILKKHL